MLLLKLAYRNILRQRRRSLLTGLSMAGGYALFAFSLSLLFGSYNNVIEIFTLDRTGHIQIHKEDYLKKPKIYKTIDDPAAAFAELKKNPEVLSYTPRVFAPALAYAGDKTTAAEVVGIDPVLEPKVSRILEKLSAGVLFSPELDPDGYYPAVIGYSIARTLNLSVGDEIVLISQGADGSIANDIYTIVGVVGNKNAFDRNSVYLPIVAAQEFLTLGSRVHEIALLVDDPGSNETTAAQLQNKLPELSVAPWQVVEETFYRTMESDKQGNYFSMGLIVFLVFVGVLNTVLMSVMERTVEFGVLRAIGSRPLNLISMITLETTLLSFASCLVGLLIAVPATWWFSAHGIMLAEPIDMGGVMFQHMKGEFSLFVLTVPMAFMMITAALISIPPGLRAARISPRDALGSH